MPLIIHNFNERFKASHGRWNGDHFTCWWIDFQQEDALVTDKG
jgi:hypothetical protein